MCGICGWYRRGGAPVDLGVIEAQCASMAHSLDVRDIAKLGRKLMGCRKFQSSIQTIG